MAMLLTAPRPVLPLVVVPGGVPRPPLQQRLSRQIADVSGRCFARLAVATGFLGAVACSQQRRSNCVRGVRRSTHCHAAADEVAPAVTSRLEKRVVKPASHPGEVPSEGDLVVIHYVGRFDDGTVFDSSRARNQPFQFHLGESEVIDGWDMLVGTMALGERAELVCPPEYAYGEIGAPPEIPANATLFFDVELLDIGRPMQDDEGDDAAAQTQEEEEALYWEKDEEKEAGRGDGYIWEASGSGHEIQVSIPLEEGTKVKDLDVDVRTFSLRCRIGGKEIVDGKLFAEVLMDESHWDLEKKKGKAYVVCTLAKMNKDTRWTSLLDGGDVPVEAPARKPAKQSAPQVQEAEVVDVDAALNFVNAAAEANRQ